MGMQTLKLGDVAYQLLMEGSNLLVLLLELTSLLSSCCSSLLLGEGIHGLLLSQPGQQLLCLLQRSCMLNCLCMNISTSMICLQWSNPV